MIVPYTDPCSACGHTFGVHLARSAVAGCQMSACTCEAFAGTAPAPGVDHRRPRWIRLRRDLRS